MANNHKSIGEIYLEATGQALRPQDLSLVTKFANAVRKSVEDDLKSAQHTRIRELECVVADLTEQAKESSDKVTLYDALRAMHWTDNQLTVINATDAKLGCQTYSGDMLDEVIRKYVE